MARVRALENNHDSNRYSYYAKFNENFYCIIRMFPTFDSILITPEYDNNSYRVFANLSDDNDQKKASGENCYALSFI